MKEFFHQEKFESGGWFGMSEGSFVTMVNNQLSLLRLKTKYGLTSELVRSLAEMGIIGRCHAQTGEPRFDFGDIQELERLNILPKGFFNQFCVNKKK